MPFISYTHNTHTHAYTQNLLDTIIMQNKELEVKMDRLLRRYPNKEWP